MLPYLEQPSWHLGPLTIHAFGVAVAAAMWIGLSIGQKRFQSRGLDPVVGRRLGTWMVVGGLIGAHLFSVLFYFPQQLRDDPWLLLRVWEDISSLGGILGGILAALFLFSTHFGTSDWRTKLRYGDVVAFAFAPALAVGRIGCALAHDHPGLITDFPLAVSLRSPAAQDYIHRTYTAAGLAFPSHAASLGFHDLGLYECLFVGVVIVPLFVWWDRRPRQPGFYLAAFAALYFSVRFALDKLRISDVRYVNLTPAQWLAAGALIAVALLGLPHRRVRFALAGAIILGTAWACWGGP